MITYILCIQGTKCGKTFTARNILKSYVERQKDRYFLNNKAIINLMSGVADYLRDNKIEGELIKIGGDNEAQFLRRVM